MIEAYVDAMLKGDCVALAACFAPKCRYFDYCPQSAGRDNYHVFGREAIEMFFRNKFTFRVLSISDPVIESPTSANFLVAYGGSYFYARATIECHTEDGLIQELTVRPA
jgi:hypothetical protein